jgi:hypothetical protein
MMETSRSIAIGFAVFNVFVTACSSGNDNNANLSSEHDSSVSQPSSTGSAVGGSIATNAPATGGTVATVGKVGTTGGIGGAGGITSITSGIDGGKTADGGVGGTTKKSGDTTKKPNEVDAGQDANNDKNSAHDSGPAYVPPDGEPMTAQDRTWTWVNFPESKCRDGSSTGIGVNLVSGSRKVMIYLEGGGACYNQLTCTFNPASWPEDTYLFNSQGIFDRNNDENPLKDWNFFYIPFCTGDVHGGNNAADPGIGTVQEYRGYKNVELFLQRIVPTIKDVEHVLLTGVSAGGFGAALTADLVARSYPPDVAFTLIDDSGPPMSSDYLPTCLQKAWRELWGFDSTFLKDCGAACPNPNDFAVDWAIYLADKYHNATAGIISSTQDAVISTFFGFGADDCTTAIPNMPAEDFTAGLMDLRSRIESHKNFSTYYIESTNHTWLGTDSTFYDTTVGGVRLVDWVTTLVNMKVPAHVSP